MRNAELQEKVASFRDTRSDIPHSALRIPHYGISRISTPRFANSLTYSPNGTASSGVCTPLALIRPSTCITLVIESE